MSEAHNKQHRTHVLGLEQEASDLHLQGKLLKCMGWIIGATAVGAGAIGIMKHDLPKEISDNSLMTLSVFADVGALAGGAALIEAGRRSGRRADTYEAALLQAYEYKTLADRVEESVQFVEAAIDDASMQKIAPTLPPLGEPQAYL